MNVVFFFVNGRSVERQREGEEAKCPLQEGFHSLHV